MRIKEGRSIWGTACLVEILGPGWERLEWFCTVSSCGCPEDVFGVTEDGVGRLIQEILVANGEGEVGVVVAEWWRAKDVRKRARTALRVEVAAAGRCLFDSFLLECSTGLVDLC